MANHVNRRLDGPPTQGRRRECERRLRQQHKETDRTLIEALDQFHERELADLAALDAAEQGFLEAQIALANLGHNPELLRDDPETYARAVMDAVVVAEGQEIMERRPGLFKRLFGR